MTKDYLSNFFYYQIKTIKWCDLNPTAVSITRVEWQVNLWAFGMVLAKLRLI